MAQLLPRTFEKGLGLATGHSGIGPRQRRRVEALSSAPSRKPRSVLAHHSVLRQCSDSRQAKMGETRAVTQVRGAMERVLDRGVSYQVPPKCAQIASPEPVCLIATGGSRGTTSGERAPDAFQAPATPRNPGVMCPSIRLWPKTEEHVGERRILHHVAVLEGTAEGVSRRQWECVLRLNATERICGEQPTNTGDTFVWRAMPLIRRHGQSDRPKIVALFVPSSPVGEKARGITLLSLVSEIR